MDEQERSNTFLGGIALVFVLVVASMVWVWSSNGRLGSVARAEVPPPPKAASPAEATAGLEKRVVSLEAKAKTPPTFDTSQLEAQIKDLGSQLTALQTQLGSFKVSDFDALKTKVDTKGDRTATANSESVKKSIDALQADIGNLHTRFDQLSQQVASVTAPEVKTSSTAPDAKTGSTASDAKTNSTVHEVKNSPHSKSK
jgi:chromosome segregation ATPase